MANTSQKDQDHRAGSEREAIQHKPRKNILGIFILVLILLIFVGLIVLGILYLTGHPAQAATIRDIFVILLALESLVVGVALVILIIQIASLINLINNDIRPVVEETRETLNIVKGTSTFIGDQLVKPVIRINSYVAGLIKLAELFSSRRKGKKEKILQDRKE
jgi:hypothetical protein